MNTRRLGVVALFLVLQCADRIGPNDSPFDPDYEGGDYNFETGIVPGDDTLNIFCPYKLWCTSTGEDSLTVYRYALAPALSGNPSSSVTDRGFSDSSIFYFTAPCTVVLTITAVKPNGREIQHLDTLNVVNPYRIEITDSGRLEKGMAILARVRNTRSDKQSDAKLTVQWYRGKTVVDTLDFMLPCTLFTTALPDTVKIHARLLDTAGNYVMLDTIKSIVRSDERPYVKIATPQAGVPIDTAYTIEAVMQYADVLVWESDKIGSVTTTTASFTHRWTDAGLVDTVIVTAKNRFGVEGNSDTILITPRAYRYGLDMIKFPTVIPGRDTITWIVAATDTGRRVPGDSIEYAWTISPARKATVIVKNKDTLQLFCNPVSDTDSFGISVFAFHGTDSSWTKYSTITLFAFRPVIKLSPFVASFALNDSAAFKVTTFDTDSDSGGKIDSVFYRTSLDGDKPHLMKDSIALKCSATGNQTVRFWCIDNRGFCSDTVRAKITITSTKPYFQNATSSVIAYLNDSVTIRAPAEPGNKESAIVAWTWDIDGNGTGDRTTTVDNIDTVFASAGVRTITVGCRNREGDTAVDHAVITIDVQDGTPSVTSVACTPESVYIFDTVALHIKAFDGNGELHACSIKINDTAYTTIAINPPRDSLDTLISVPMPDTGTFRFSASVTDDDSLTSPFLRQSDSVIVRLGKPTAVISFPDSVWINDTNACTVRAGDPNGTVKSRWVRWDTGSAFVKLSDSTALHNYTVAGQHTISAFVIDDDAISSDTVSRTVNVRTGAPSFGTIATVNPGYGSVFVNDTVRFTVKATDPNDEALTVKASWNGDTAFTEQLQTTSDSVVFSHSFSRNKVGPNTVRFRVVDHPDGYWAESSINVQVHSGAPTVSLLSVSPIPDSLFVRDPVRVRLRTADTNGTIKKIYVNWQGANVAQDSVICNNGTLDTAFTHAYDTTGGNYTVRLWAVDNDTMKSAYRDTLINIRKCPPRLWGDTGDTLWVVVDKDYGDYYYKPHHEDTNGVIDTFYFGLTSNRTLATAKYRIDSAVIQIDPATIHTGNVVRYIWAKDDDGFIGTGTFRVFADSAPKPITVTSDPITGGRKLSWSGIDTKDSLATEFRILVKKGSQPDTSASSPDEFKAWTRGGDPAFAYTPANTNPFTLTYPPTGGTGTYYYQIMARDKRGTISMGPNSYGNFVW